MGKMTDLVYGIDIFVEIWYISFSKSGRIYLNYHIVILDMTITEKIAQLSVETVFLTW